MSCKFWKFFVYVIVVCTVSVSLFIVFFSAFGEKEKIKAVQGWDTNVREDTYVVLLGCGASEEERRDYLVKNPEHKLSVLELYIEPVSLTVNQKWLPKIFVVIWEDGTIVWGSSKEDVSAAQEMANHEPEIKYFMSRIERDKVKELLFALSDSSVWDGTFYVMVGGRRTQLAVRSEGKEYTIGLDDVDGPALYEMFLWNNVSVRDRVSAIKSTLEWRRVTKKVFNMIPSESRPVSISYERYTDRVDSWIGIIGIQHQQITVRRDWEMPFRRLAFP